MEIKKAKSTLMLSAFRTPKGVFDRSEIHCRTAQLKFEHFHCRGRFGSK